MQLNRQQQAYSAVSINNATQPASFGNLGQSVNPTAILVVTITGTFTGTSPSLAFKLRGSVDGTNFADIKTSSPTMTVAGTYRFNLGNDILEPYLQLVPVLGSSDNVINGVTATLVLTSPDS
jgi:hypothetical protein